MPTLMHSAIYEGYVWHRRLQPQVHAFQYRLVMFYLDLDEIAQLSALSPWFSAERWNLLSFYRRDYHGAAALPLKQTVLQTIHAATGEDFTGSVRMLANLRNFGFVFNPLTCYYCFDATEQLRFVVAEVTNTPWGERHCYVLPVAADGSCQQQFAKAMHVSPFMPMALEYCWRSSLPNTALGLSLSLQHDTTTVFSAGLQLERQPFTRQALHRALWRSPWMSLKVVLGIYWQALKLWRKKTPIHPHPKSLRTKAPLAND
jgi:uncharacterized protein